MRPFGAALGHSALRELGRDPVRSSRSDGHQPPQFVLETRSFLRQNCSQGNAGLYFHLSNERRHSIRPGITRVKIFFGGSSRNHRPPAVIEQRACGRPAWADGGAGE
jgi:hypothetical protein